MMYILVAYWKAELKDRELDKDISRRQFKSVLKTCLFWASLYKPTRNKPLWEVGLRGAIGTVFDPINQ